MNALIHTPSNTQLVALTPSELPAAQRGVRDWCLGKIHALSLELKEQRENDREARKMMWRNRWPSLIARTVKRMVYYAKIKKAVESGYLIVPNFNVDVIAVRVDRDRPPQEESSYRRVDVKPSLGPAGTGRYVDEVCVMRDDSYSEKKPDGTLKRIERFTAIEYDDNFEFPASLVKPAILSATDRAMALRVFDRIGVVRASRRSDPIVVGQIIDPRERYWAHNPRCVSFFVAWWLDTRDL